jgi:hypothetical protein
MDYGSEEFWLWPIPTAEQVEHGESPLPRPHKALTHPDSVVGIFEQEAV